MTKRGEIIRAGSDFDVTKFEGLVHLAGPYSGIEDWQSQLAGRIHEERPGVAVVRGADSYAQSADEQVLKWEERVMDQADAVVFWLTEPGARERAAPVDRGMYWLGSYVTDSLHGDTNMILGMESGSAAAQNRRLLLGRAAYNTVFMSLDDVAAEALRYVDGERD